MAGGQEGRREVQLIDVREPDELLRAEIKGKDALEVSADVFRPWSDFSRKI